MRKIVQLVALPEGQSNYPVIIALTDDGEIWEMTVGRSFDGIWHPLNMKFPQPDETEGVG